MPLGATAAGPRPPELLFAVNEGVTYRITPHETRERYRQLAELLGRVVNRPVLIEAVESYAVLKKGLEERRYELAFVHPAHHSLRAVRDQGYQVLAVTRGYTDYRARFLVSAESKMRDKADLRGARMVMPDADSITAWMARATLRDMGLDPMRESVSTTRYQDGIPFMMENGFYQVGITASGSVIRRWTEKGGRVLLESKPVPIKHLIASPAMPKGQVDQVRAFFLALDTTPGGKAVLQTLGFSGFDAPNHEQLQEAARWLGL